MSVDSFLRRILFFTLSFKWNDCITSLKWSFGISKWQKCVFFKRTAVNLCNFMLLSFLHFQCFLYNRGSHCCNFLPLPLCKCLAELSSLVILNCCVGYFVLLCCIVHLKMVALYRKTTPSITILPIHYKLILCITNLWYT